MNKEKIKIFGWNELNKKTHKLCEVEVEEEVFVIIDELTTEIVGKRMISRAYATGKWFLNFNEAKKAMIEQLQSGINWRTSVLEKIKYNKKPKQKT